MFQSLDISLTHVVSGAWGALVSQTSLTRFAQMILPLFLFLILESLPQPYWDDVP